MLEQWKDELLDLSEGEQPKYQVSDSTGELIYDNVSISLKTGIKQTGTPVSAGSVNKIIDAVVDAQGRVNAIEETVSQDSYTDISGSSPGIYKSNTGLMIQWWTHPANSFANDIGVSAAYKIKVTFPEPFITSPTITTSTEYGQGIQHSCCGGVTKNSFNLYSSSNASGVWVNWTAIGRWK